MNRASTAGVIAVVVQAMCMPPSDSEDWKSNLWCPYDEVNEDYDGAVLMKPGKALNAGAMKGDLEDCWVLTAISGLAHKAPDLLRDMVLFSDEQVAPSWLSGVEITRLRSGGHVCVPVLSRRSASGRGCGFIYPSYRSMGRW